MLRNIPNRVDQAGLKTLLDQTSWGQYDFMYLRIDFANNCNVGYAFINFMDPMAIVPFARARAGKKWNLFQSDKIAEISYASKSYCHSCSRPVTDHVTAIQGRDCLIQKFRNSSVMLERPAFRPKVRSAQLQCSCLLTLHSSTELAEAPTLGPKKSSPQPTTTLS